MPRDIMRKVDLLDRIYRMKRQLHESSGIYREMNHEQRQAADRVLNEMLDILSEYSN